MRERAALINGRLKIESAPGAGTIPGDAHLASRAGLCPGNNESAGKRRSMQTTKGSPHLRAALTQAAWAVAHTKETYPAAQYHRLARRMGRGRRLWWRWRTACR